MENNMHDALYENDNLYHTFERDNRQAKVLMDSNGFYVEFYQRDVSHFDKFLLVERRDLYKHSESYAESAAENWVDGVIR